MSASEKIDYLEWVGQRPLSRSNLRLVVAEEKSVMEQPTRITLSREPWNKGKLVGQKAPLKLQDIWAIRVRLQITDRVIRSY